MALTITEADAVNTVSRYFTGDRGTSGRTDAEWDAAAREALVLLVDHAYKQLGAGHTAADVLQLWARVEACPWQDCASGQDDD